MFDGAGNPQIKPKLAEVIRVVAQAHGITVDEIKSACRERRLSWPRQLAAYLCREMTDHSYPEIGRVFGDRDHTTILFSYRKISARIQDNERLWAKLDILRHDITAAAALRWEGEKAMRLLVPPAPDLKREKFVKMRSPCWWTGADLAQLKRLRDEGLSRAQIAWRLQRTVGAVARKLKEQKLTRPMKAEADVTAWMEQAA